MCDLAPLDLQLGFDNSGLQLGRLSAQVSRVLLSLDITEAVIQEAEELEAQLIISHHPLILGELKSISDQAGNEKILRLAQSGIGAISMHTNLDIVQGGVNDVLIRLLGAEPETYLDEDKCGRIGCLKEPLAFDKFLGICKDRLEANGLRYYDSGRRVEKLAVMGGSGGFAVKTALEKGCDTYVTGDIKYDQFLLAAEHSINLIDAGHFCTENPVIPVLCAKLKDKFPDIEFNVSKVHGQTVSFA